MRYCIDTNIIIDYLRGDVTLQKKIALEKNNLYITHITLCELYKGAYLDKDPAKVIPFLQRFLQTLRVIDFTEEACILYGRIHAELRKKGKPTPEGDIMIASVALSNDCVMVTRNKKHFASIPELTMETW